MNSKDKSTTETKTDKLALVPGLRFAKFQNAGPWRHEPGGRLFYPVSNKNHNSDLPILAITQEHGAIPRELIDYHVSVSDKSVESYKVVEIGDFIISLRSFQGGIEYSKYKGLCSPAYIILKPNDEKSTQYFRHYFKTDKFIADLNRDIEGIRDGKMVSYDQFSKICLPTPSTMDESNYVADCLSSLDELITAEAQKVEALKAHKKGLMQLIFPAEGETIPKLRFPEFRSAPEWQQRNLIDIIDLQDGFSFSSLDFVTNDRDAIQVIRITDINNRNANEDKVYIPTSFVRKNNLTKYLVENGDLLLSLTGAAGFNFFFWNGARAVLNQRTTKVKVKNKSDHALSRLLEPLLHEKINARGEGQNNNLSKEFLGSIVLVTPAPTEQQKIADCLSSLDGLISAHTNKVEALKAHKKGLMQQLFPSPVDEEGE